MHYNLYIDSIFLINFVMDLYVLSLTKILLKRSATRIRIFLAAIVGALGFCIFLCIPGLPIYLKVIAGSLLTGAGMIGIAFRTKRLHGFLREMGALYVCSFLLGGFLLFLMRTILKETVINDSIWFLPALGYAGLQLFGWLSTRYLQRQNSSFCTVILQDGLHKIEVKALIDTGNSLIEPISKKPVSILERKLWEQLPDLQKAEKYKVIPFHSIGKKQGILEGYEVDTIWIQNGDELQKYEKVVIAISKEMISVKQNYQMIVNPKLIE